MGSPLSQVVENIYMEYFEEKAINSSPLKLKQWRRYVDGTNFPWSHGNERLRVVDIHEQAIKGCTIFFVVKKRSFHHLVKYLQTLTIITNKSIDIGPCEWQTCHKVV